MAQERQKIRDGVLNMRWGLTIKWVARLTAAS